MEQITTLRASLASPVPIARFGEHSFGPWLQGFMMQQLDREYAEYLHQQARHPYSMSVEMSTAESLTWRVNALNLEAAEYIVKPLQTRLASDSIELRSWGALEPSSVSICETDPKTWVTRFYASDPPRKYRVHFLSPTAFRVAGAYVFYPNLRLLFQSLQMR